MGARRSPSGRRRAATRTSRQRSKYEWKNEGVHHQATFNNEVQDWLAEKLRTSLEDHFHGRIPADLEETIKSGEEMLNERTHLLKIADKFCLGFSKGFC